MAVFSKQNLERYQERNEQFHGLIKNLSEQIAELESAVDCAYDEEKKSSLSRLISSKKNKLESYEQEIDEIQEKIISLEKSNSINSLDENQVFSSVNQIQYENLEDKEEESNPESKVIRELQREEKQNSEPFINQAQDITAKSLITDDEIKNTILYTVTFFPQLNFEDFDHVVSFFLEDKSKEFISISEVTDERGEVKKVEEKKFEKLLEIWQNHVSPIYKDELLSQCYIEPHKLSDSFQQVIDFTENYSYLRNELKQVFYRLGFYTQDKFKTVQTLIFWHSERVVANAIKIAVNMALTDPNRYGKNFLTEIIGSLGEYEEQKLLDTTLNSLLSEQSFEQTIFKIIDQQKESEDFKSLICDRLAALVYQMEEHTDLQGISNKFLESLMKPPFNRYDVVLEICKYLRTASSFDEFYWIKQILARGDAETKDKAYKFLLSLLKQNKKIIYERLKVIAAWLPNSSQNPENYSTLHKYALQIFVEYSLEQISNFNLENYGQYSFRYSLFYSLQAGEIEEKLDILVGFLFCLYIDKSERYHREKLALSYIVDKNVNAIDLIGFLIAQWHEALYEIQKNGNNSEAFEIFEQLLNKIINQINPYLRKELIKSWVRFGSYLRSEAKVNREFKQEFISKYNLVKQLKEQFIAL